MKGAAAVKKVRDFILGFLMLNGIWWALSLSIDSRALPQPTAVYGNFPALLSGTVLYHLGVSLMRVLAGMAVSLVIGTVIGYFMAAFDGFHRLFYPLVYFVYPIPKTALLPAAMLILGLGNASKILIMVLTTVFQVIITTRDAAAGIDPALYQVGRSAGKSQWSLIRQITLPAIVPELLTGIRINMGTALAILMIVEAYGTRAGIGYYILDAWSRMNYNEMYGGIVVLSLAGGIIFLLIDLIYIKVCKWK